MQRQSFCVQPCGEGGGASNVWPGGESVLEEAVCRAVCVLLTYVYVLLLSCELVDILLLCVIYWLFVLLFKMKFACLFISVLVLLFNTHKSAHTNTKQTITHNTNTTYISDQIGSKRRPAVAEFTEAPP